MCHWEETLTVSGGLWWCSITTSEVGVQHLVFHLRIDSDSGDSGDPADVGIKQVPARERIVLHPRSFFQWVYPWKWWLEDDTFLLGFGHFSGAKC